MDNDASPAAIEAVVRAFLAEELKITPDAIGPLTDLRELPRADSVKLLRAVARIERHYGIELADDAVFSVRTIEQMVRLITDVRSPR